MNRFLQTFSAVSASSVLVSGTLFLLTSAAPWTPPQIENPSTAESLGTVAIAVRDLNGEIRAPVSDRSERSLEDASETRLNASSSRDTHAGAEGSQPGLGTDRPASVAGLMEAEATDPLDAAESSPRLSNEDVPPQLAADSLGNTASAGDMAATESTAETLVPLPPRVIAGAQLRAGSDHTAAILTSLPPQAIATELTEAAAVQVASVVAELPPRVIAANQSNAATDEIAQILAELPPAPQLQIEAITMTATNPSIPQATVAIALASPTPQLAGSAAARFLPPQAAGVAVVGSVTAKGNVAAAESPAQAIAAVTVVPTPPPLPRRKPLPAAPLIAAAPPSEPSPALAKEQPDAQQQAATPAASGPSKPMALAPADKPAVKAPLAKPSVGAYAGGLWSALTKPLARQSGSAPQQAATPAASGAWTPMALAPSDKPALKAPLSKPNSAAYAGKIWSALARHKPRAGQRGSASVAFAIGENGALRAVRIARTSGNSRIDQLALATVRNAAPFPPPPSGAVSYTIRIDFR